MNAKIIIFMIFIFYNNVQAMQNETLDIMVEYIPGNDEFMEIDAYFAKEITYLFEYGTKFPSQEKYKKYVPPTVTRPHPELEFPMPSKKKKQFPLRAHLNIFCGKYCTLQEAQNWTGALGNNIYALYEIWKNNKKHIVKENVSTENVYKTHCKEFLNKVMSQTDNRDVLCVFALFICKTEQEDKIKLANTILQYTHDDSLKKIARQIQKKSTNHPQMMGNPSPSDNAHKNDNKEPHWPHTLDSLHTFLDLPHMQFCLSVTLALAVAGILNHYSN